MLPRHRLGGGICFIAVFSLVLLTLVGFCIGYGGDDGGKSITVVRNSKQVIDHAAMLLLLL